MLHSQYAAYLSSIEVASSEAVARYHSAVRGRWICRTLDSVLHERAGCYTAAYLCSMSLTDFSMYHREALTFLFYSLRNLERISYASYFAGFMKCLTMRSTPIVATEKPTVLWLCCGVSSFAPPGSLELAVRRNQSHSNQRSGSYSIRLSEASNTSISRFNPG